MSHPRFKGVIQLAQLCGPILTFAANQVMATTRRATYSRIEEDIVNAEAWELTKATDRPIEPVGDGAGCHGRLHAGEATEVGQLQRVVECQPLAI
jgi:hypothetical protein